MPQALIDTHCHLDFTDFDDDRIAVMRACAQVGVQTIVIPATQYTTWQRTLDLVTTHAHSQTIDSDVEQAANAPEQRVRLYAALGLHPAFNDAHKPQHLRELTKLAEQHQPIAIGEIGLDFHSSMGLSATQKDQQLWYFTKQLAIACALDKPVIVHNRKAHDECLKILQERTLGEKVKGGIIHAFNGSIQQAEHYINLGFYLGFGGMLTFSRSVKLQALVKAIPIDHIVLETDAPDMTVSAHRGQRNSPAYLPAVLAAVAHYKGLDVEDVAKHTTANAQRLFKLDTQ